jgi:hypothetical protein
MKEAKKIESILEALGGACKMDIFRQGDVIITPSKVPKGAKQTGNEVRIASETGNPHVLKGKVFSSRSQQYIVLEEPTEMTHPQHAPRLLQAGSYEVRTVRDYIERRLMD